MKKQILLLGAMLFRVSAFAQQPPTNTAPGGVGPSGQNNQQFWSRAGNNSSIGQNNIFGTNAGFNSPIYTVTNGVNRTRLNGDLTQLINGVNQPVNGYFGIGPNGWFNSNSPWAMLHLEGPNTTIFPGNGWRSWMRTGLLMREESDQMYVGMKREATNQVDAVISWSDDASASGDGPDKLRFLFTGNATSGNGDNTNPLMGTSFNGYEFMRMQAVNSFNESNYRVGYVGIGPLFGTIAPQNRLHMNAESGLPTFLQISNVAGGGTPGTGQLGTDGLKIGTQNVNFPAGNRQAGFLQWQENTPFIIQTEWDGLTGGIGNGERIRITSIGALNNTEGLFGGLTAPTNVTRIGVSYLGNVPLTRPRSLLHLGLNDGIAWRNWMDLGTFTASNSGHLYVGTSGNSANQVIAWGGIENNILTHVFTKGQAPGLESQTLNGLEGMRMAPTDATGVFTGIGGDPEANLYGPTGTSPNPTSTLEVNSWGATNVSGGSSGLRFTNLNTSSPTIDNPGTGVLAVDENGDVIYVVGGAGGGSLNGAHNGTTISLIDLTKVALGQDLGQVGNPGELLNTREIPMNDFNLLFTDAGSSNGSGNNIGVGTSIPDSKVHVVVNPTVIGAVPSGVKIENFASSLSGFSYGNQIVVSNPTNFYNAGLNVQVPNAQTSAVGIDVNTSGNVISFGVQGWTSNGSIENRGISGVATVNTGFNSVFSNGVVGQASNASNNTGGTFSAVTAIGFSSDYNYGVIATSGVNGSGSVQNSFGIFAASYAGSNVSRSGYFVGQMETTSGALITSDQQFKTNVNALNGSLKAIQALKPVSYYMDTVNFNQFNFDSNQQFGFIAQQVETAFPNLVYQSVHPATFDSLGNELTPATSYKSLNYNAIIPINTQAIIELNQKVDKATLSDQTIKTNVQDLNGSLNKVLQMRGVSYDWNQSVNPSLNLDSANHIGFIAQEIAQVDPRLTFLAADSLLHVEYDKVVPILAEAIEELNNTVEQKDSIINDLNNRLTNLENCLSALLPTLCQMNQSAIQANTPAAQEAVRQNLQVTLSNRSTIILDQNVPNPFAEQTVINFSIPASVAKAQMHFYDGNGRLIQTLEIAERGLGAVTVFGSDLSSGTYTYTLVADGAVVATKKMMKQ